MCLFKRNREDKKKYKITFTKGIYDFRFDGLASTYKEISDYDIYKALYQLQEKYDFEIVSMKLQSHNYTSQIIIKCKKENKDSIFLWFCCSLCEYIKNVSIK